MLSRFFESLYHKVFVNIVVLRSKTIVLIETVGNNGIMENIEESFNTTGLDDNMYNFISSYTNESPFYYVSLLDKTLSQGASPTCEKAQMDNYFDRSLSQYTCYHNRWVYYTSKVDIHSLQKEYSRVGVDFIFSPFVVLSQFFKDKIDTNMAMFILVEDTFVTLCIFDNSELLYAKHLDMEHYKGDDELLMEDQESNEIELDLAIDGDMNLEEIDADELDNLGDIEDLDSLDDLDEFSDAKDIEEELQENLEEMPVHEVDSFNEDYQRFLLIQGALNDFYKNDKHASQFIETVYIADGVGISGDLKRYLEEEMFLNVYIRNMDINVEICELAKAELK